MGLGIGVFGLVYVLMAMLDSNFRFGLYQNALIPIPMLFIAIPVALLGAIAPDLDIRTSYAYAVTVIALVALVWYLVLNQRISAFWGLLGLSAATIGLLIPKHRGFFHTLLFAVLFAGAMGLMFADWRLGVLVFGTGCSHLAGDR